MSEGALREVFAEFGISFDDEALQRGGRSVGGMIARVRELGQLLVANEIVGALRVFASQFEEQAGRIQDTADSLGLATDELQRLQYAAIQGGVGADQLTAALSTLQRNAAAAAHGGGTAAEAFRTLGIQLREADGTTRSAGDLMGDLAVNMDRIEDPARRTALAQQVLGESGRRLLTILHGGEGGLAAWADEFERIGGGLSQESIAAAGAYGDELNRFKVTTDALRATLAVGLLPTLTGLVTKVRQGLMVLHQMTAGTNIARVALGALGLAAAAMAGKVLVAWLPVLLPFAKIALAVAVLVLIVEDFVGLMQGADSQLGRFLDRSFGLGASARFVREVRDGWAGLRLAVSDAGGAIGETVDGAGFLLGQLRQWVDETGTEVAAAFGAAWGWVEATFGGTWDRITAKVRELFDFISGGLSRAASALGLDELAEQLRDVGGAASRTAGRTLGGAGGAGDQLGEFRRSGLGRGIGLAADLANPAGMFAEWREILRGSGAPGAAPAAPTARAAPARTVTHHRTTHNRVTIHGATDAEDVANRVERRLDERAARERDAAHPQAAEE